MNTMSGERKAILDDDHQAVASHGRAAGGDRSTMMNAATVYQIRVSGHLSSEWGEWFGDLEIDNQPNGEATLSGVVRDQAALHGLLQQLFALNLTLLAVNRLEGAASARQGAE
jgi:hypothetical protein